jgi:hypothetical protein
MTVGRLSLLINQLRLKATIPRIGFAAAHSNAILVTLSSSRRISLPYSHTRWTSSLSYELRHLQSFAGVYEHALMTNLDEPVEDATN